MLWTHWRVGGAGDTKKTFYIPRLNSTDKCPYTISYSIPSFDKNKHYKIIELINSHHWPGYVGCKDKYCVLLHRGPICTSLIRVVQLSILKIEPTKNVVFSDFAPTDSIEVTIAKRQWFMRHIWAYKAGLLFPWKEHCIIHGYRDRMWSPINWQESDTSNWYSLLILKFCWLNFDCCCKGTSMVLSPTINSSHEQITEL